MNRNLLVALLMLGIFALTACSSTEEEVTGERDMESMQGTIELEEVDGIQVVGQVLTAYGNEITIQVGTMGEVSSGTSQGTVEGELPEGEIPEGMTEGEMPSGEMPEGMTESEMPEGEMPEGEIPEGMTEGEMPSREVPEGLTEGEAPEGGMTSGGEMSGSGGARESTGELPEDTGVADESGSTSGASDTTQGGMMAGGSGMMSGTGEMDISSMIQLTDEEATYTIPIGTEVSQYGTVTTFSQITAEMYVVMTMDDDGTIISVEILG